MKIAIYTPYLDTAGGGEKYLLTAAEVLSKTNKVDLLLDNNLLIKEPNRLVDIISKRFDLNLSKIALKKAPLGAGSSFVKRMLFFKDYDLLLYLTDGSIFYSTAKKSVIHIQSPIERSVNLKFWDKIKLRTWDLIIYNSYFTRDNSNAYWGLNNIVIYPPVDVEKIKPLKKKKYIISVGRFFGYLKEKKHEIMINVFKDIYKNKLMKGWSLHLVGSALNGDVQYLLELKRICQNVPIMFYPNLGRDALLKLYGESSIYWHAMGYGEPDPTKMEHFGISTVEAMAGGCVPIVIHKGGQIEIVENNKSGYFWEEINQLKMTTLQLVKNKKLINKLSKAAVTRAQKFGKSEFEKEILKITHEY